MSFTAKPVAVDEILRWHDLYRAEMSCQVVLDNLHVREGWTQSFLLAGQTPVGYGSIAVGGPWKGTKTIFEFYVLPEHRSRLFDLFSCFREASQATAITVQTNDKVLTVMTHLWARNLVSESILFEDGLTTHHLIEGAVLNPPRGDDHDWRLEVNGQSAARGGILYHYNRPYGDIYMEVAEPFRRRGIGAYLVQELKRMCYEGGSVPSARCNPGNVASRLTLQKAGFVPCANILNGDL